MSVPEVPGNSPVTVISPNNPLIRPEHASRGEEAMRWIKCIGACTITGLVTALPASAYVAQKVSVEDELGTLPITLRLRPGEVSSLTGLPKQNVYTPESRFGFGASVQIDDLPAGGVASILSPQSLKMYAGLYDNPHRAMEGYKSTLLHGAERKFWHTEPLLGGVAAASLFVFRYAGTNKRRKSLTVSGEANVSEAVAAPPNTPEKAPISGSDEASIIRRRKLIGGFVAAAVLVPSLLFASEVSNDHVDTGSMRALPGLEHTSLAGTVTDNKNIYDAFALGIPKVQEYNQRRAEKLEQYETAALAGLKDQQHLIAAAKPGESAVMLGSDIHRKKAMIKLGGAVTETYNSLFPDNKLKFLFMTGDLGYGSGGENNDIKNEGQMAAKAPVYSTIGNHDTHTTEEQMNDAGIKHVDKSIRDPGTGFRLSGANDPDITRYFEQTELRGKATEDQVGAELYKDDHSDPATISGLHEGYAVGAYLGLENVTKQLMTQWFAERGSTTIPWNDGVRDLPTSLLVYGHWHRAIKPRVVWNDDGSWTLVMELNTMGGAVGDPTLNHFSLPNAAPEQTASFPIVYINNESKLVTGYQMYTFYTDGRVKIGKRVDIGSADGLPYSPSGFGKFTEQVRGQASSNKRPILSNHKELAAVKRPANPRPDTRTSKKARQHRRVRR